MPRFTTFADRCHRRAVYPPAGQHYPAGITSPLAPLTAGRHYPAGAGAG